MVRKKVKLYNLSSHICTKDEISALSLGPKFVPLTNSDIDQTKVDILSFSRKLLLKAQFFNSVYEDASLIKPVSNYIPKSTHYPELRSIVEELEIFSNELQLLEKTPVTDNMTPSQRRGLDSIKQREGILYMKADKGSSPVLLDKDFYKDKVLQKLNTHFQ